MLPIPAGSIVIGEFIQDFFNIKSNNAYIIVTRDEGIVFKVAHNNIETEHSLHLVSLNKAFEPYNLPIAEVTEVWKFVCYLNTSIPEPESDISALMKQMNDMQQAIKKLGSKIE